MPKAKYFARNANLMTELNATDGLLVVTPDGTQIEIYYRPSEGKVSVSVNGTMIIEPRASNVVRITKAKE